MSDELALLGLFIGKADEASQDELRFLIGSSSPDLVTYAEWLTNRGDPRGEALTAELAWRAGPAIPRPPTLRALIDAIDPRWWSAVLTSRTLNCGASRRSGAVRFRKTCDQAWDGLAETEHVGARHCAQCDRAVHWCATVADAERQALAGECIAVPAELVSRAGGNGMYVGRPDFLAMWATRLFGRSR